MCVFGLKIRLFRRKKTKKSQFFSNNDTQYWGFNTRYCLIPWKGSRSRPSIDTRFDILKAVPDPLVFGSKWIREPGYFIHWFSLPRFLSCTMVKYLWEDSSRSPKAQDNQARWSLCRWSCSGRLRRRSLGLFCGLRRKIHSFSYSGPGWVFLGEMLYQTQEIFAPSI